MVILKPHQSEVVNFMKKSNSHGIILYHGLGSGKTISSIGISQLYPDKDVVVIVPASMRTQWDKELKIMNVDMSHYQVISYEKFLIEIENNINYLKDKVVIVDEAHRIRSSTGKIATKAVKALQESYKVVLLTGTPMVNGAVDLSPLVNAVKGENVLPTDNKTFKQQFYIQQSKHSPPIDKRCKLYSPVTCSNDGVASTNGLCTYHYYMKMRRSPIKIRKEAKFEKDPEFEKKQKNRIERLRAALNEGRLKPNTKEYKHYVKCVISYYMPDLTDDYPVANKHYVKVNMSPEQNKSYQKAAKKVSKGDMHMLESGREVTRKSAAFNAFLNVTRQLSNTYHGNIDSPKLLEILKYIKNGPKPCIIYSNWLESGINPMSELLKKNKITYAKFTGELSDAQKKSIVNDYNNGKIDVLLLSSSGGEGLDLKNTRQIHIMEPHWNIAKINQVIGRGIRYKSHEKLPKEQRIVDVYYWIAIPTTTNNNKMGADEYLYYLSDEKTKDMAEFLDTAIKGSIEKNNCL